jgi:hypothetical protein
MLRRWTRWIRAYSKTRLRSKIRSRVATALLVFPFIFPLVQVYQFYALSNQRPVIYWLLIAYHNFPFSCFSPLLMVVLWIFVGLYYRIDHRRLDVIGGIAFVFALWVVVYNVLIPIYHADQRITGNQIYYAALSYGSDGYCAARLFLCDFSGNLCAEVENISMRFAWQNGEYCSTALIAIEEYNGAVSLDVQRP